MTGSVHTMLKNMATTKQTASSVQQNLDLQNQFPLNLVYATADGDIGYHLTGLYPKRKYQVV